MTRILNPQSPVSKLLLDSLLVVFAFALAFAAVAWRLDQAPDIFTDEILYTRAGIRVAAEGALVWDNGEPLFVHPPLYFLAEGMYLRLTTDPTDVVQIPGDIFAWVYHARYLNALFAGATAVVFYLLGRQLQGRWLGLLLTTLFILDPFGVRINRRAMLETMAAWLSLAGMALLLTGRPRVTGRLSLFRAIGAGLLLGAGMLTKELTFTAPLAVFLFGLWELWRSGRKDPHSSVPRLRRSPALLGASLTVTTAGLTYLLFPFWGLTTGRWDRFMHVKWLSLNRLLGLAQLSGWNRPHVSLLDFLVERLIDYGSSYLMLGLGGAATLFLLLTRRHTTTGRLLTVWGLILYPFYAFVAVAGSGNDQFFYFLLIPAILLVGYAAAILPEAIGDVLARRAATRRWLTPAVGRWLRRGRTGAVVLLLAAVLPFNLTRWWLVFGAGTDNGYYRLAAYVQEHLPLGEPLNASGDAIKFEYFFPHRPITDAATPSEAVAGRIHYFALAPKDVWARYGRTTPELATWITARGERLFAANGDSYGEIYLYRVDYPNNVPGSEQRPTPVRPDGASGPYSRSFPPAQAGFINGLVLALGLWGVWCLVVGTLAIWIERLIVSHQHPSPRLEQAYR